MDYRDSPSLVALQKAEVEDLIGKVPVVKSKGPSSVSNGVIDLETRGPNICDEDDLSRTIGPGFNGFSSKKPNLAEKNPPDDADGEVAFGVPSLPEEVAADQDLDELNGQRRTHEDLLAKALSENLRLDEKASSFEDQLTAGSTPPKSSSSPPRAPCRLDESMNSCVPMSVPSDGPVDYEVYQSELNLPDIVRLIQKELCEPYSIYTYRYFIHNWPHLCFMAKVHGECVGAIVCKLGYHKKVVKRGYIAMLAVDVRFRKRNIGYTLVRLAIERMIIEEADEVALETETTNIPALRLYENLGFVRDRKLLRYYLNGEDALRLKLWLR